MCYHVFVQQLNINRFPLPVLTDEYRYRILKLLEADSHASQRRIADELGISLGRVNYCLQALIEKGLVKVNNFRSSTNKRAYLYLLTPRGIEEKARVTARFLRVKLNEYETLKRELEELQREAVKPSGASAQAQSPQQSTGQSKIASYEKENAK
jgi:EPS-associated MarR family transcriptional regulator